MQWFFGNSHWNRVKDLLSILSPDPKPSLSLAIEPGKSYTKTQLVKQYLKFYRLEKLPLEVNSLWNYCCEHHSKGKKGSLEAIGVTKIKNRGGISVIQKTELGRDLGDPIAARGIWVVNKLYEIGAKYCTMWKILGAISKQITHEFRRWYVMFEVIRFLAENHEVKITITDLSRILKLSDVAPRTIRELGEMGLINYHSVSKEREGKTPRGWSRYRLIKDVKKLYDEEEIIKMVKDKKPDFCFKKTLKKVIKYIRENPEETFEHRQLSEKLGINRVSVSNSLSILSRIGLLKKQGDFEAKKAMTIVSANEYTKILWEELFRPIEKVAKSLKTDSEILEKLNYYQSNPEKLREDVKRQLKLYINEKIPGPYGEKTRESILSVFSTKQPMKTSYIYELLKEKNVKLKYKAILRQLNILVEMGKLRKIKEGYYEIVNY